VQTEGRHAEVGCSQVALHVAALALGERCPCSLSLLNDITFRHSRKNLTGGRTIHTAIASSLVRLGISPGVAQAGADHWSTLPSSGSTRFTETSTSISNAAPFKESIANAVGTTSTTRQPSLPSPQSAISVSAASSSQLFFDRDVNPVPFMCPLPGPSEPLQTTRQLAYCLALFQASVQEDNLFPDALEWRRSTTVNTPDEKRRLETLSIQVIEAFAKDTMKDAVTVVEVVQLAPVLSSDHSRFLLKTFIDTVNQSEILDLYSLKGLAKAIQGSAPGSVDSDDLVTILRCLHKRLGSTHSASHHNHYLLLAVSRVLDTMADAHIGDVDRVNLHEPLTDLLRESESSDNPYLTFQAAYATQALLNVSDDESI